MDHITTTPDGLNRVKQSEERMTILVTRSLEDQERRKRTKTASSPSVPSGSYVVGGSSASGSKRSSDDENAV